jgi:O-antigen/teichoic acid export membrane protein
MYRRLAVNTLISAAAFFLTSVISLAIVPILLRFYGLEQYGLIVLARLFLPTATFALFDFGYSEIATQAVARARTNGDWQAVGRQLAGLGIIAGIVALSVGAGLTVSAGWIALVFRAPSTLIDELELVICITAAAFIPILLGTIFEGVIKGFEEYRVLRFAEVIGTLLYAGAALGCVHGGLQFQWIAIAYIASLLVRISIIVFVACLYLPLQVLGRAFPTRAEWRDLAERCRVMAANKWLGVAHAQAAPFLVGVLLGATSAGAFDIVLRFPRYVKGVLSVLTTAVLPVAARLESRGESLQTLGETGLLVTAIAGIPVSAAGMTFSEPLLSLWVGDEYSRFWAWQSLMFVVPILNTIISFGGAALLVRPHVTRKLNLLYVAQAVIQLLISFAFVNLLSERAFILGQVTSSIAMFYFQMRLLMSEKKVRRQALLKPLAVAGISVLLSSLCFATGVPQAIESSLQLLATLALWMAINFGLIFMLVLSQAERVKIWGLALPGKVRKLV